LGLAVPVSVRSLLLGIRNISLQGEFWTVNFELYTGRSHISRL
jgi:hypothetical protein